MNNNESIIERLTIEPYIEDNLTWYTKHFSSLNELAMYLEANPQVNEHIFPRQHSITQSKDFAGEPYEKALEYLKSGYTKDYDKFLKMIKSLDTNLCQNKSNYVRTESPYGSIPNVRAFLESNPKCMIRVVKKEQPKFVTIYFNLSYPAYTQEEEVLNRGLITIQLINLLEKNGYNVCFKVFSLCMENDEVSFIDIILKKNSERLDTFKCYYPLCCREFLRRILFRAMESQSFKLLGWGYGYGMPCNIEKTKQLLNINNNAIVIGSPDEMDINGNNIFVDTNHALKKLGLKKYLK